jgi:hypothetical protein
LYFRTKPQSHEEAALAAKRLSFPAVWFAAPLIRKAPDRPKPSSSWLCVFVRHKKALRFPKGPAMDAETSSA